MQRLVVLVALALSAVAFAQSTTTGALHGRVLDAHTREPVVAATVAVTAGRETRTTRTAADGTFWLDDLLPGDYDVTIAVDAEHRLVRRRVRVAVNAVTALRETIDRTTSGTIVRDGPSLAIDPRSTSLAFVADRRYLTELPMPGRHHTDAMGAAPTGRGDGYGVAYADATSLDNRYLVNGLDTTDALEGRFGTALPSELVREVAVTTGGHAARFGRSLGAEVVAVSRSGTNELHGSVFASVSPGFLQAAKRREPRPTATFELRSEDVYDAGFGAELGGPLVRDRAWFHVGFAPQLWRRDHARELYSRTDCREQRADGSLGECDPQLADGVADVDPATGYPVVELVESRVRSAYARSYPAVGRIDVAWPGHQGMASAIVVPWASETPEIYGSASAGRRAWGSTMDFAARWSSRWRDDTLYVDATAGWHRARSSTGALYRGFDSVVQTNAFSTNFDELAALGAESAVAIAGCADATDDDRFPSIVNCPGGPPMYPVGGPGWLSRDLDERWPAQLVAGARLEAGGRHDVSVGVDVDIARSVTASVMSGGYQPLGTLKLRQVRLAAIDDPDPIFDQTCGDGGTVIRCQILGGDPEAPGVALDGRSVAQAVFVRDIWQPLPELIVHGALRYDAQRLKYPGELRGQVHPVTGRRVGENAIRLVGNISPRVGIAYDPTHEGRAKLFAQYARLYESLPTQIAGHFSRRAYIYEDGASTRVVSASLLDVARDLEAGHVDEVVAGAAHEVVTDLTIGATWQHRELRTAIEDVGYGSAPAFVLANPGIGEHGGSERARRRYDAVALTLTRRFARLYVQGSYVYSRAIGNYSGAIDYDLDSFAPDHLTQQFDHADTVVNRYGPMPQDRPHYLKLDAAYTYELGSRSAVVVGTRVRALSGVPRTAVTAGSGWPRGLLLPRGALGRTDATRWMDLHLGYRRRLSQRLSAELYVDIFGLLDDQTAFAHNSVYGQPFASGPWPRPIDAGTYEDLIWLKRDASDRGGPPENERRNPSFGAPTARYKPRYVTLGARLSF